jgi:two-component system chemotaxis sensor kinase CheA
MDECISDFLIEAGEAVATLDNDLLNLECRPCDMQLIGSIFRTFHTVKGTSGFLGLSRLGQICHAGENVLGKMRDGTLRPAPDVISVILQSVDVVKTILSNLELSGTEGSASDDDLIALLNALHDEGALPEIACPAGDSPDLQVLFDATPGPEVASPAAVPPALALIQTGEQQPYSTNLKESAGANTTIRVGIDLLESLMTTVSELVLSRNQLLQLLRGETESPFAGPLQRLSMITSELQESVMKTRMQPIGNAWLALPRIVRDLGRELGKKIDLVMEGSDTELDRQVLELIKDPLTHMVRNAADHGLEMPDERSASGKSETGKLRLCAFHEGGHIIIRISDDGRGIDPARIRRKAVEHGLATEAELIAMTDASVFSFIFRPGFSTAAAVTSISGRGVGMDVVLTNVERIGGAIDIESELGRGTSFVIKFPLTLAIVPALIVGCASERFAIPQISVVELVRASRSDEHRIEQIGDSRVLRLRDRLLPLIDLRTTLQLAADDPGGGERLIIVTKVGSWFFGIIVDRIYDTEEIVVKPVSPLLKNLAVYSGNTILGDGSICMIIDPAGMISQIGRIDTVSSKWISDEVVADTDATADEIKRFVLVFAGPGLRKAIPLDQIERLEDIEVSSIRRSDDGRLIVPYRGSLMLLVPAAAGVDPKTSGRQPVLVFSSQANTGDGKPTKSRHFGLLVDSIIDIIQYAARIDISSEHPDVVGATIIDGEPTEILDTGGLIERELSGHPALRDVLQPIKRIAA